MAVIVMYCRCAENNHGPFAPREPRFRPFRQIKREKSLRRSWNGDRETKIPAGGVAVLYFKCTNTSTFMWEYNDLKIQFDFRS